MDHNATALSHLYDAETNSGDVLRTDYAPTVALLGIGHALLDVAAAIREQTKAIERNAPRSPAEPAW